jgi:hypothetical protein
LRDSDRANPRRIDVWGVVIALMQTRCVPKDDRFEHAKKGAL